MYTFYYLNLEKKGKYALLFKFVNIKFSVTLYCDINKEIGSEYVFL